jgi:hypothetical protein
MGGEVVEDRPQADPHALRPGSVGELAEAGLGPLEHAEEEQIVGGEEAVLLLSKSS